MRLDAALTSAADRLSDTSDSPRLDAEMLLCRTIDVSRSYVFAHPEDELDELTLDRFEAVLQRRIDGEPMAYIMGVKEFWSHELLVSPATLVPRPETELLVEIALIEIPRDAQWHILDLGTGSGAIAIAVAGERPMCNVVATDISAEALAVARENVRQTKLANVLCLEGNWTEPVAQQCFDIILSNPPYVRSDDDALSALRHEPLSGLTSGADGLDDIRILAATCRSILATHGRLMMEHGADQGPAVASILENNGWTVIACHNDLAGKPRVTVAR